METREVSVISVTGGELGPAGRGAQAVGGPLLRGASRVTSRSSPARARLVRHRGGELQVAVEEAPGELAHQRVRAAVSSRR